MKNPRRSGDQELEGAIFRGNADEVSAGGSITYILQIRNPLTPSSITVLIKTSIFKRFVTRKTSFLAELSSKQGMNIEYPSLNFFQLTL